MTRAVVELVLGVAAAVGCAASWIASRSSALVPPVADGEPATTSVAYYPPLMLLALVLGTLAGSLLVVAAARWQRTQPPFRERACRAGDTP